LKPRLSVLSDSDELLTSLVACIGNIECSKYFSAHLGLPQREQRQLVADFQMVAMSTLKRSIHDVEWHMEYRPSAMKRDSIDIFGKGTGFVVVVELDKSRADQVAKKFVSRMALLPSTKVYFVSLCYPGTDKMNPSECEKYFGFCSALALRMGSRYASFIVE